MNKKLTSICVIIVIITTLTSCKPVDYIDNDPSSSMVEYIHSEDYPMDGYVMYGDGLLKYYDGYLIIKKETAANLHYPWLMKYNVQTGNITHLCSDPLCSHVTPDCPLFGGVDLYYIYDNKVYFKKSYMYSHRKSDGSPDYYEYFIGFCSFDITTQKLTIHSQQPAESSKDFSGAEYYRQIFAENYCYYYEFVHDEEKNNYYWSICRMDLKTNKVTVLDSEANPDGAALNLALLFHLDGRLYWSDLKTIFTTDYDMKDKKIIAEGSFADNILTDGKRLFWVGANNYIYSMNSDGSDRQTLDIGMHTWTLTSDYIYYVTNDKTNHGKITYATAPNTKTTSDFILTGSTVRRCRHDGSGDELVWSFEGEYETTRFIQWNVVGNYIYATYITYIDPDNDGLYDNNDAYQSQSLSIYKMMVINIVSGEVCVI